MSSQPTNEGRGSAGPGSSGPPGPAQGVLRNDDGRRRGFVSAEFVRSLHFSVLETFGDQTQDILYQTGFEWGLQDMSGLSRRLRDEYGTAGDLWQMEPQFVFDTWWSPLAAGGWGAWELAFATQARGVAVIDVRHSLVAASLGAADDPVCHLYAGLFAGALSFFDRAERHAVEIRCQSVGDSVCTFVIGPGADIDAVETWRQQRVAPADILARLR